MAVEQNVKNKNSTRENTVGDDPLKVDKREYQASVSSYNDVFKFLEKSAFSRTSALA